VLNRAARLADQGLHRAEHPVAPRSRRSAPAADRHRSTTPAANTTPALAGPCNTLRFPRYSGQLVPSTRS